MGDRLGYTPPQPSSIPREMSQGHGDQTKAKILSSYPYPLAYSYRLPFSSENAMEETKSLLRGAENLLAFLGSLSLALVPASRRSELVIDVHKIWGNGIGPGDWWGISKQCRKYLAAEEYELPRHLARSLGDKKGGIAKVLDGIVCQKNHFKHERALLSEGEAEEKNPQLWSDLNAVYHALEYLSVYPIRSVRRSSFDPDDCRFLTSCLVHQGLAIEREDIKWTGPLPEKHLYVELRPTVWASLHPLMQRLYCRVCGDTEFFFLDKLHPDGSGSMKSLERGHVCEVSNVLTSLERLGLRGKPRRGCETTDP